MTKERHVVISAGEASGDHHAARMLHALRAQKTPCRVSGMGGPHLAAAGMEILVDCRDMAVVGIVEVLRNWRFLHRQLRRLQAHLAATRPDLLILVDYPDFNLKLARTARELGIPVLFYVSPQVWAWRPGRVHKIGTLVDMMAVLFPFETELYERAGVPVRYVGHPLVDDTQPSADRQSLRQEFALADDTEAIALLPGSRTGELGRMLPLFLETARVLAATRPRARFLLAVAGTLDPEPIQQAIAAKGLDIRVVGGGRAYDVIEASDVVITASGTATLEVALMRKPMAVVYRVNWLTYLILRQLVTIEHIALANIVADQRIVQEFVQGEARPAAIANEVVRILDDRDYRREIEAGLDQLRTRMGEGGAAQRTASLVKEMLQRTMPR